MVGALGEGCRRLVLDLHQVTTIEPEALGLLWGAYVASGAGGERWRPLGRGQPSVPPSGPSARVASRCTAGTRRAFRHPRRRPPLVSQAGERLHCLRPLSEAPEYTRNGFSQGPRARRREPGVVVRVLRQRTGRGPTRARTDISSDLAIVTLEDYPHPSGAHARQRGRPRACVAVSDGAPRWDASGGRDGGRGNHGHRFPLHPGFKSQERPMSGGGPGSASRPSPATQASEADHRRVGVDLRSADRR